MSERGVMELHDEAIGNVLQSLFFLDLQERTFGNIIEGKHASKKKLIYRIHISKIDTRIQMDRLG